MPLTSLLYLSILFSFYLFNLKQTSCVYYVKLTETCYSYLHIIALLLILIASIVHCASQFALDKSVC